MSSDIYSVRRVVTVALVIAAAAVVCGFMMVSHRLVDDLSKEERGRMELWADATRRLAADSAVGDADVDFMLSIIESNHNIPVLLTDSDGEIIMYRNFDISESGDSACVEAYLHELLPKLQAKGNVIDIPLGDGIVQKLYYSESQLLRRLSYYPYIQVCVMLAFVVVVYFAVTATRKAEQNKVWVGLSKETAHQLGTPISSLMAWIPILEAEGVGADMLAEIDKDVRRLSAVAARFSKVGSRPALVPGDVCSVVSSCVSYMSRRVGQSVSIDEEIKCGVRSVMMCVPLFEWVMENLIKNAVDAMGGEGVIKVSVMALSNDVVAVDVADSGRGIPRNRYKRIFRPGFTTRERGWGLGLTLAKRIIENYHGGKIFVKWSSVGAGTVIRIELPCVGSVY